MAAKVKISLSENEGVHFKEPIPQIKRDEPFEVVVGSWNPGLGVERVKLSRFRSLYFDHFEDCFVEGGDRADDMEIEITTDEKVLKNATVVSNGGVGVVAFPFDQDKCHVPSSKHRLIEFDMAIDTGGGYVAKVDPAWDEKP